MNQQQIRSLLTRVAAGETSVDDAILSLRSAPFEELGFAKIDHHRGLRQGVAEVVFGAGKTPAQIEAIVTAMRQEGESCILITRLSREAADALAPRLAGFTYHETGRIGIVGAIPAPDAHGKIVIATGGTSDLYVAEEAALTAEALGNEVVRLYDVGVAGIHRLLACADRFQDANVIVAVAGMEGALPSVVGGMVSCPVIAVPTSVGYGASFQGVAALLGMLNSCASGVSVVNIDNGFGAGYQASLINRQSVH